jgi:hypothetical protein
VWSELLEALEDLLLELLVRHVTSTAPNEPPIIGKKAGDSQSIERWQYKAMS